MIEKIIALSVRNRFLVVVLTLLLMVIAAWCTFHSSIDAVPDLSDVEVIVATSYAGQSPDVVEKQVTYPLETQLLHVPQVRAVRGMSTFELSLVTVVFKDGTNLYWARSRVLEYLNSVQGLLPKGVTPQLGPDATGVGWAYQYVLFPGWYAAHHPGGIWHDAARGKWYAHRGEAPLTRRSELVTVRAFSHAGVSPLSGKPLAPADIDLAGLRSLQDWFVRYQLEAVHGVSEVAPVGGFVKTYQIVVHPEKLRAYHITLNEIADAVRNSNNDIGGSVVDISENQYILRSRGYLKSLGQFRKIPLALGRKGTPVYLSDVADVEIVGGQRQGICEWNGRGEVVGGIVIVRTGADTYKVVQDVKKKIAAIQAGLPPGVIIKTGYDRTNLIRRAIGTLSDTLLEEMIVVAVICIVFLLHGRSSLVAITVIPGSMLISLMLLYLLHITANIMSLGGIAIAIGVVVDSAIVMIENAHRHLNEEEARAAQGKPPRTRSEIIVQASQEVGPSLFFSLLIITISFLPIFILPGESGKTFAPLALTKTFAMAAAAVLSITIIPVLMLYFVSPRLLPKQLPAVWQWIISLLLVAGPAAAVWVLPQHFALLMPYRWLLLMGWLVFAALLVLPQKIVHEEHNSVSKMLQRMFSPVFHGAMRLRWLVIPAALALVLSIVYPLGKLGTQETPPLYEGDLLYMPQTDPSIGINEARYVLQQTDKILRRFPEVKSVFGQTGRAETATDNAPMDMVDTVVRLKPPGEWPRQTFDRFYSRWPRWMQWPFKHTFWPASRPLTQHQLIYGWTNANGTHHPGMDDALHVPGFSNTWTQPVANRTAMVNTGIKTPLGIEIFGPNEAVLSQLASHVAGVLANVHGASGAEPNQAMPANYLDIQVRRAVAARFGMTVGAVQKIVAMALGGSQISTVVAGAARYPIDLRFGREERERPSELKVLPVPTPDGHFVPLAMLAHIRITPGPAEIDSQNATPLRYVTVNLTTGNIAGFVARANAAIGKSITLPAGYSLQWIGAYRQIQQTNARLMLAVPLVLTIIIILLFMATNSLGRVLGVLLSVPFGLVGAFWLLYALHYEMSAAVWVGIIALSGLSAEMGLVLLLYIDIALKEAAAASRLNNPTELLEALYAGAVRRIRPMTMTVGAALIGLLPLLWAAGSGTSIMRRLAAPMIGGLITSFVLELLVLPALVFVTMRLKLTRQWNQAVLASTHQGDAR
ncbi:MAG: efflux RND transporter permease subunit [Phycisphaerae bacterium]